MEGSGDRGLAVAGRTGDKEAAPGTGHDAEHLKRGVRQDKVGKSSPDGIVSHGRSMLLLVIHHGRVGVERNGCSPDISVQLQEPPHPLPTAIEHRISAVLGSDRLPDLDEALAIEVLEQGIDHADRQGEPLSRPLRGAARVRIHGLEGEIREEAKVQATVFHRRRADREKTISLRHVFQGRSGGLAFSAAWPAELVLSWRHVVL